MNGDTWQRITKPGFSEKEGTRCTAEIQARIQRETNSPLKSLGMKTAFDMDKAGIFWELRRIFIFRLVRTENVCGSEGRRNRGGGGDGDSRPRPVFANASAQSPFE